ncbi:cellulose synthase [Nonomuraea aridisoli]|uniref:Cellulose synthase n=1 Tax=Nonomuraea aridisoli TaxID=2070368 RepID=A0A2W2E4S4_9ACTN|nr:cellulose synthase [Nonomuraea aridisoli]PZG12205.1 cellulose synthase [Nonomuraea aridisoli]
MDTFNQIAWLPLCGGLTVAGLVLAFLAFRRRGAAPGLRTTAWALLPMAAYLTGALPALWTIGSTLVGFVTGLVFNPAVWAGVVVAGLSAVLFVVSGVMRGRKLRKKETPAEPAVQPGASRPAVGATPPQNTGTKPKPAQKAERRPAAADDDFSDIEELLKRRGIS